MDGSRRGACAAPAWSPLWSPGWPLPRQAIHDPLRRLLFVTLEQGGLRLGEAVRLRWGDVDRAGLQLRLPRSATKRDKARWVYLPEWLIEAIEDTCPLEDRVPDRKVFGGITEATAYQTMLRACQTAGVPHIHPHDLRHRRSRSGIGPVSRPAISPNAQGTRGRR